MQIKKLVWASVKRRFKGISKCNFVIDCVCYFSCRLCNIPEKKPEKPKNHRLVAKAFKRRKRKDFRRGRLSFSYGSDRDDPLGKCSRDITHR